MKARRLAATAIDYALVAAWAGLLLLGTLLLVNPSGTPAPVTGQLIGLAMLTLPVVVASGYLERRGGSPGKRLVGLRTVHRNGGLVTLGQGLVRALVKIAVPWELAHAAAWRSAEGSLDAFTLVLLSGACVLPIAAASAVAVSRRPWHDLIARTTVQLDEDPWPA